MRLPREVDAAVGIGCSVLIRRIRPDGERQVPLPAGLRAKSSDRVVWIAEDMGLDKLTTRTPLGRALLGHRCGDVVSVRVQAGTVLYELLAVDPPAVTLTVDARVAELEDAADLKPAPAKGPGSSPGAGTNLDTDLSERLLPDASTDRAIQVWDVVDVQDGELEEWWRVVPHVEADAARRCISDRSPLGRALLGHRAGEVVSVRPPVVNGVRGPAWPVTILAVKAAGLSA